jgi:hypothetical protein
MVNPISSHGPSIQKIETPVQAPSTPSIKSTPSTPSTPATPPSHQEDTQAKVSSSKPDVVQLSFSAQAQLLRQQGMTLPQIALRLGLDISTVTSFFPQSGSGLGTA